jgi:hypothetical protein
VVSFLGALRSSETKPTTLHKKDNCGHGIDDERRRPRGKTTKGIARCAVGFVSFKC